MSDTKLLVTWQKNSQNNEWFDFLRLDLDAQYFKNKKGVFVVWYLLPGGAKVIQVGSGNLAEQLKNLRANPAIAHYSNSGAIKVSWVAVNGALKLEHMAGAEAYLYDSYNPLMGSKPNAAPMPISLMGER